LAQEADFGRMKRQDAARLEAAVEWARCVRCGADNPNPSKDPHPPEVLARYQGRRDRFLAAQAGA
jgi:hypothetical protein